MGLFDKLVGKDARISKHARVFISRDDGRVVVVTMHHNQDGVLCEDRNAAVLKDPSDTALGECAFAALNATARIVRELRNTKRSEWPAYIASGEPSIRQFQKRFVAVHISAANDHNLAFELQGLPEENATLRVTSMISSSVSPDEFGARIREVFVAARDRKL